MAKGREIPPDEDDDVLFESWWQDQLRLLLPEEQDDLFWSTKTASKVTGMSASLIRSWCKDGKVIARKPSKWMIKPESLKELMRKRWKRDR